VERYRSSRKLVIATVVALPLTVNNGTIEGTADVSGRVNRDGSVKVSINGVYANGTLTVPRVGKMEWRFRRYCVQRLLGGFRQ